MELLELGLILKTLDDKMRAQADAQLKVHGLTMRQSLVLLFLSDRAGEASQKEIETYLGVAHPTAVGIVSRMEESGFLECSLDEHDKRIKLVQMTPKSVAIVRSIHLEIQQMDAALRRGFSREELQLLVDFLQRLHQNVDFSASKV